MQFLRGKMRFVPAAIVLLAAVHAGAGVLDGDGSALFSGTKTLTDLMMMTQPVDVEYAVYDKGMFDLSFSGADPTGGAEYVFAYQLYGDPIGWQPLYGLSVGILDGEDPFGPPGVPVDNVGFVELDATASPNLMWVSRLADGVATSVRWDYAGDLTRGHWSDVLFYTSPYGPAPEEDWDDSNVSTMMGIVKNETLPHPDPIPEPATLVLVTAGLAAVRRRRRTGRH